MVNYFTLLVSFKYLLPKSPTGLLCSGSFQKDFHRPLR